MFRSRLRFFRLKTRMLTGRGKSPDYGTRMKRVSVPTTMKKTAGIACLLLACGFSAAVSQEATLPSIWDGVFSEAQAQRGKALYQARCAICHGQDLVADFADIESPSLTGTRFNLDWVGKTIAERFQRIRRTMPPTNPGGLDDQTAIDIVAFILEFNGYPSAKQELRADIRVLEKIAIERASEVRKGSVQLASRNK